MFLHKFFGILFLGVYFGIYAEPWVGKSTFAVSQKQGVLISVNGAEFFAKGKNSMQNFIGFNFYRKSATGFVLLNKEPQFIAKTKDEALARLGEDSNALTEFGLDVNQMEAIVNDKKIVDRVIQRAHARQALARLFGLAFNDKDVFLGENYQYKIEAVYKDKKIDLGLVNIFHQQKYIGFLQVSGLKIEHDPEKKGSFKLSWNPLEKDEFVVGYNLYRRKDNEAREKLNPYLITFTTGKEVVFFEHLAEVKNDFSYAVEPVSGFGFAGKLSDWVTLSRDSVPGKIVDFVAKNEKIDGVGHRGINHVYFATEGYFDTLKILRKINDKETVAFETSFDGIKNIKNDLNFYYRNAKQKPYDEPFLLVEDNVEMPGTYLYKVVLFIKGQVISESEEKTANVADKRVAFTPTNFQVKNTEKGVLLQWQQKASTINGTITVYRREIVEDPKEEQQPKFTLASVESTVNSFLDIGVTKNHIYEYSLEPVSSEGEFGVESEKIRIKAEIIPEVIAIRRFDLNYQDPNICLLWDAQRERYADKVLVFRNNSKLGEVNYGDGRFCDVKSQYGQSYDYTLKTKNKGSESPVSEKVSFKVPFPTPPTVEKVKLSLAGNSVSLSWDYKSNVHSGFEVLRREKNSVDFVKISKDLVSKTSFSDTTVTKDKVYFYSIVAIGKDGKRSVPSLPVETVIR